MRSLPSRRLISATLVLAVAGLALPRGGAQSLAPLTELEAAHNKFYVQIENLRSGKTPPSAADKDAMEAEARWLIYRFAANPPPDYVKLQKDLKYFVDRVEDPNNIKQNRPFVRAFSPVLVKHLRDVFDQDLREYRQPIVNLAPMLAQFARLKDETIGDYLGEILMEQKDQAKNKHDVIKLNAARALRDFMPVHVVPADEEITDKEAKVKARELRYVEALVKFIERPGGAKLSEEEQNAIRFVRREAIETLALTQAPSILAGKKLVEAPIAPVFLRVLSPKGGLEPAPGLAEKVEAAIGICQIKYAKVPEYDPEVGLHLVALFVYEFGIAYNKDYVDISPPNKKPAILHWRLQSKRLEAALKDMSTNAKGQPIESKAIALESAAKSILAPMQGKQLSQVNQNELVALRNQAMKWRPKAGNVFKTVKTHVVDLD